MSSQHLSKCCVRGCDATWPVSHLDITVPRVASDPAFSSTSFCITVCEEHSAWSLRKVITAMQESTGSVEVKTCDVCREGVDARDVYIGAQHIHVCAACFANKPITAIRSCR